MIITGYDNFWFADLDMDGELEVGNQDMWQINQTVVGRGSGNPILATGVPSPRAIDVTFVYSGTSEMWEQFDMLLGNLRPTDQGDKRKLYGERPDGTEVWRYARIELPNGWPNDETVNTAIVRFVSEDPRWFKVDPVTVAPFDENWTHPGDVVAGLNTGGIALPNSGWATVHPTITFGGSVVGSATGSGGGWGYYRSFTVTNDLTRTVSNYVGMLNAENTAILVTSVQALASGNDYRIIGPNGLEVPRTLVAWNTSLTYVYFYIAQIEPGETQTYSAIYGNPSAGAPETLVYPYAPAFLTDWYQTSASTAAVDAGKTWVEVTGDIFSGRDNKFKDGALYIQTGANAGSGKKILSHTYNTPTAGRTRITVTSAFTNALATTDDILVVASRNGTWMYDVESDESRGTDAARGLWYSSSGESPPDIIDFTVPGAWQRNLYYDGRDKKGQPRYSRVSHGGDLDTYTILDAQRSWEQGARVEEEGGYDGVALSMPFPITGFDANFAFTNPTGFGKAFVGQRGSGGNDWLELASTSTVYATATAWAPTTTIVGSPTQLYCGLIPTLGDEVDQTWRRSAGSSTAVGTTTTLTDSTKSWNTDQWIGAKLKLTGGRRSGQTYTVTTNTATVLTFTPALGTNLKVDQPYEVINPPTLARLRNDDRCTVTYDDSGLVISSLVASTNVVDESTRVWIGGGKASSSVLAGHRRSEIEIGKDADLFVLRRTIYADSLVLDSSTRSATSYDPTGIVRERYVDPRVRWRYTDEDGNEVASMDGLPIVPGTNVLTNPGFATNILNWTKTNSGVITTSTSRDTAYYAKQEGGTSSLKLNTTASTAPCYSEMVADDRIPITEGALAQFACWVLTETNNIKPLLGIRFYTSALATISTDLQSSSTYTAAIWYGEAFASVAPANAAYWAPLVRANITSGSPTGSIFMDDFNAGSPILFIQADHYYTSAFSVEYTEAYYS